MTTTLKALPIQEAFPPYGFFFPTPASSEAWDPTLREGSYFGIPFSIRHSLRLRNDPDTRTVRLTSPLLRADEVRALQGSPTFTNLRAVLHPWIAEPLTFLFKKWIHKVYGQRLKLLRDGKDVSPTLYGINFDRWIVYYDIPAGLVRLRVSHGGVDHVLDFDPQQTTLEEHLVGAPRLLGIH